VGRAIPIGCLQGEHHRPTLRRGDRGELVEFIQKKIGIDPTGPFGPKTEAAVRRLQDRNGAVPDGIVGPKTWALIDALP
jgi:peptidoglycan hydrolase-like protein with peptidoglycan-binding domain